jgi:transcription elongation factor Elf1
MKDNFKNVSVGILICESCGDTISKCNCTFDSDNTYENFIDDIVRERRMENDSIN